MLAKFADFDLEGKKIFIDQMEKLGEKMQIIMTRIQLADDPLGNEYLRMQRVQMLEAGTNMAATMDGFKSELEDMRRMVELEESCADPVMLDTVKQAYRQKFAYASKFNPMEVFSDPAMMEAAMDPDAMKAVSEVVDDPSKISNWRHKPQLYALLQKMLQQ
ncbi:conserved domain [Chlorella sorokiniana]|uniref:Conserved domain n=1 Tax=Chlorella sorokiniana TaxID=3076 RepID=A0A2P6TTD0_CHLSO|nr:conserved domain [Chlorella sorokiniana]|eukprot:PRW57321.1 conserved domain [Chlorella sorokiniana]